MRCVDTTPSPAELKAVEKKFQLESEFSVVICGEKPACWEKAYRNACDAFHDAFYSEAAGGKPQCDIVIHELVKNDKLRQAGEGVVSTHRTLCFEYNRTEWLMIHNACQKEAQVERDPKSLNRWSYNSAEFLEQCREVINQVRESKKSIDTRFTFIVDTNLLIESFFMRIPYRAKCLKFIQLQSWKGRNGYLAGVVDGK